MLARRGLLTALVVPLLAAGVLAVPGAGAAAPGGAPPLALSDDAKQELILDIVERFVRRAKSFHTASDLAEPATDFYRADGPGVTQPRGAGIQDAESHSRQASI